MTANPFAGHELLSPTLSDAKAAQLLIQRYGRTGTLQTLGSHQDQNFLVGSDDGRYVLKISNPGFTHVGLEAQNAAMLHLAERDTNFRAPVPLPDIDGSLIGQVDDQERTFDVRLVTFLEGTPLSQFAYLSPTVLQAHGRLAAGAALALADFDHPGLDRILQWDCRHARDVVTALLKHVSDEHLRDDVDQLSKRADAHLEVVASDLRVGVIHADVTDVNVVALLDVYGRPLPDGLIDFGDMLRTWIASDVATAAVSLIAHDLDRPLHVTAEILRGFHAVLPLTEPEVAALWPMVVARTSACCVSSEQQASLEPDNAYAQESRESDWRIWQSVREVAWPLAESVLRDAVGHTNSRHHMAAPTDARVVVALPINTPVLDLSVQSDVFSPGDWESSAQARRAVADRLHEGFGVGRFLEGRLNAHGVASVTTGMEVFAPVGTPIFAPLAASVKAVTGGGVSLHVVTGDLNLVGISAEVLVGAELTAGQRLGRVVAPAADVPLPPHVFVQSLASDVGPVPRTCDPTIGTLNVVRDPSYLIGYDARADRPDAAALMGRRNSVLATTQEHYYVHPPRIERGWRHHLFDTDGRRYLDMVNNVALLGHSHPAVERAVSRQLRLLNTNSRFHYEAMVEFSERLVSLLPDGLDSVFLVSTGSEANEVALRLMRAATGRKDVVALRSAYHGWTAATDEVSTSIADNPDALTNRPPWIHTLESPNTYRGPFRGQDAGSRYANDLGRVLSAAADGGRGLAGFIAEPVYGNAGGMLLPDGYLQQIYSGIRDAGGLCIADEVQVGYGRLGEYFWGFEQQGVVPDIVSIAKCTGNGIPVGAVITTRDIAASFEREGSFFSSMGGSPVGCVAAIAVLDAMERECLQENARTVGSHLRERMLNLAGRHQLIGTVHGLGLYQGIELVRDRETLEPATQEAFAICERMLELGVIVQPTSDHMNILKVKPPLCIDIQAANLFVDALDQTLTDGW